MTATLTRLRPLLIGIVVLLFTAGIAFAGKPSVPPGLSAAAEATGKSVPVQAEEDEDELEAEAGEEDEETREETDQELDEPEVDAESEEAGDNCASDPTTLTEAQLAELRHGSIVCWAAHQETPEGYANHGAWVSEWARQNHGHEDEGAVDAATGEATADATGATARANGKGNGRGNGKAP